MTNKSEENAFLKAFSSLFLKILPSCRLWAVGLPSVKADSSRPRQIHHTKIKNFIYLKSNWWDDSPFTATVCVLTTIQIKNDFSRKSVLNGFVFLAFYLIFFNAIILLFLFVYHVLS